MLNIEPSIYEFMESVALANIIWVNLFFFLTLLRIRWPEVNAQFQKLDFGLSEAPGIPLSLLHTVCWIKAIYVGDIFSILLFTWWGPGFLAVAIIYLWGKKTKTKIQWAPIGLASSYGCKLSYVLEMICYFYFNCPKMIFLYSCWIMHDQIWLGWFLGNGDRTRRTFEDGWLFRAGYVCGLLAPTLSLGGFSDKGPLTTERLYLSLFGSSILLFWGLTLHKVGKTGKFFDRPANMEYLRNIVYLSSLYQKNKEK